MSVLPPFLSMGPVASMDRRIFLGSAVASGALLLPGCKAVSDLVVTSVVRNLMHKSSEQAINTLMAPGGGWDRYITEASAQENVGLRGQMLARYLEMPHVKAKATDEFQGIARKATDAAAPVIADTIRHIGLRNVKAIVEGGPTAATDYLRAQMGNAVSKSIVGDIATSMKSDQAAEVATIVRGIDPAEVKATAKRFGDRVQQVIWDETARAEAEIRANPEITGDPELIEVFGKNKGS